MLQRAIRNADRVATLFKPSSHGLIPLNFLPRVFSGGVAVASPDCGVILAEAQDPKAAVQPHLHGHFPSPHTRFTRARISPFQPPLFTPVCRCVLWLIFATGAGFIRLSSATERCA